MSRYISAALAVSATIVSVVAQDATKSQFPATPLASKHFSYPSGIVCRFHNVSQALATNFDLPSLTKPTPMTSCVAPSSATICATLLPRARTPFARRPSSTILMVSDSFFVHLVMVFIKLLDFCLWAPSKPNSLIADTEGEEVAWCTKPGRGTRLIPPGALTGLQYMKTPDYVQVVGFIDQTKINLQADDSGGELDPHGADLVCYLYGSCVLYMF